MSVHGDVTFPTHAAASSKHELIEAVTAVASSFCLDRRCFEAAFGTPAKPQKKKNPILSRVLEGNLEVLADTTQMDIANDQLDQRITSFLHGLT